MNGQNINSEESERSGMFLRETQSCQCKGSDGPQVVSGSNDGFEHKQNGALFECTSRFRQTLDGQWRTDCPRMVGNTIRGMESDRNGSYLRMFEEGLGSEYNEYSEYSERNRRSAESERLVKIAKDNHLFISLSDVGELGRKYPKRTGESCVYICKNDVKVYKVKDPYAKAVIKRGVQPEDVIYEHLVHNLFFPETELTFEGVSDDLGDVRIILSQNFIESVCVPSKKEIEQALLLKGLIREDNYFFGNDLVSVTDIEGDNVLKGIDGKIYFVDPVIRFKKPVKEIISSLSRY